MAFSTITVHDAVSQHRAVPGQSLFEVCPDAPFLVLTGRSAFAFGDGFSNVFHPTNPALLISLGLAGVSYGDWFKWSWKFQGLNLILTACLLLFGLAVGY